MDLKHFCILCNEFQTYSCVHKMKVKIHKTILYHFYQIIVFVWSQYDGANIEQWTKGYGWRQNQGAKLKIVGGALPTVGSLVDNRAYFALLFNQLLQNYQYYLTNFILKKFWRALENVLAGNFLPLGSCLATPALAA